jgi:hypothetical protein
MLGFITTVVTVVIADYPASDFSGILAGKEREKPAKAGTPTAIPDTPRSK